MLEPPSIFDILGPVMIGPSSSHTAGASRIGYVARQLLGDTPTRAVITLYNSFAKTHKGHGTDKALIGGILGFGPDDLRIRNSLELAKQESLVWEFKFSSGPNRYHSNTARIKLSGVGGGNVEIVGVSLGGGRIRIDEIEGFGVNFGGQSHTIVIIAEDIPGSIKNISAAIADTNNNIANMYVSRSERLANMVIEVDHPVEPRTINAIRTFPWVRFARLIAPMVEGSSRYDK